MLSVHAPTAKSISGRTCRSNCRAFALQKQTRQLITARRPLGARATIAGNNFLCVEVLHGPLALITHCRRRSTDGDRERVGRGGRTRRSDVTINMLLFVC
ncbi:hypothetical protein EVAR_102130_1 [Eumeta japonica]|uniref:Uncharacterized protein n=1 Tax=Eumeta variegata TaxID=151549 RepID=A0A4C1TZU1_EUMVA|nr:hypothetical protein EVAR_102130_1 [Eumeta japonica]